MRIPLDECLPLSMRDVLTVHECITVSDRGWKGIKNGKLLRPAKEQFDLKWLNSVTKDVVPRLWLSVYSWSVRQYPSRLVSKKNRALVIDAAVKQARHVD